MADDIDLSQFMQPKRSPFSPPLDDAHMFAIMDRVFGKGKWRQTSGYRPPERENELRAEGAGTVPPGEFSEHSRGTPEAPAARDFVVAGMTPQQAQDKLSRAGYKFKLTLAEGQHGPEGPHLHIDDELISGTDTPVTETTPRAQAAPPSDQAAPSDDIDL